MRFPVEIGLAVGMVVLSVAVAAGLWILWVASVDRELVVADATPLQLELALAAENVCTRVSPALQVSPVPAGARRICLEVVDLNLGFDHGGGCVLPPPDDVVNAGAFLAYHGPCPGERDHLYRFRVTARDEFDAILALGEQAVACCGGLRTASARGRGGR